MKNMLGKMQVLIMIVVVLTCFAFSGIAFADTEVSGIISQDTVWSKTYSPYIVKGNILVDTGATLTVTEGVYVLFDGNYEFQVRGKLLVEGTESDNIIFDAYNNTNWASINIISSSNLIRYSKINNANGIIISSNNNTITYCTFSGQNNLLSVVNGANNIISNSTFNSGRGVDVYSGSNNIIRNCSLMDSRMHIGTTLAQVINCNTYYISVDGTFNKITNTTITGGISLYGSNHEITYCTISNSSVNDNYGAGIVLRDNYCYNCKIMYNNIINSKYGIYFSNCKEIVGTQIYNNNIFNHECNFKTSIGIGSVDAINNYWGTTDKTEIANKIYDFYDDFNLYKVIYEPFLSAPYTSITGITLDTNNYNLPIGATHNSVVTATYSNGSSHDVTSYSAFQSSNSNIARVDSNGLVTGVSVGDTVITATYGDQTAQAAVTVNKVDECFIATAAYGSKFEPSVKLLRNFRDEFLLTNSLGESFIKFYYKHSPPIAHFIAGNELLKFSVRVLLTPIVGIVYMIFRPVVSMIFLVLGLIMIVWWMNIRRRQLKCG